MQHLTVGKVRSLIALTRLEASANDATRYLGEIKLRRFAYGLSEPELFELVALVRLGKGESGEKKKDFPKLVAEAAASYGLRMIDRMALDILMLSTHLQGGLTKLGH